MKAHLVQIGNSRGVRLPKPLIEQAGLTGDVEIELRDGAIVISRASAPRAGWAEAAQRLATEGDAGLLDPTTSTKFDQEEWEW